MASQAQRRAFQPGDDVALSDGQGGCIISVMASEARVYFYAGHEAWVRLDALHLVERPLPPRPARGETKREQSAG